MVTKNASELRMRDVRSFRKGEGTGRTCIVSRPRDSTPSGAAGRCCCRFPGRDAPMPSGVAGRCAILYPDSCDFETHCYSSEVFVCYRNRACRETKRLTLIVCSLGKGCRAGMVVAQLCCKQCRVPTMMIRTFFVCVFVVATSAISGKGIIRRAKNHLIMNLCGRYHSHWKSSNLVASCQV